MKNTKKMTDEKILALLDMIDPSHGYAGGSVGYTTAELWAKELIELRAEVKVLKEEIKKLKARK